METEKAKKRRGDRKDGRLLRELDSLHFVTGVIYPNRCDNEAFISERLDLTQVNKYLDEKNANLSADEYKYNLFQVVVTTILKVITLKPKMNRFIANRNFYQRNEVSTAFVVKKAFSESGAEALAIVHSKPEMSIDDIHSIIRDQIFECRSEKIDPSTDAMNFFNKIPRFVSKAALRLMCFLDRHGKVPASLIETDPYYTSCVISNLGSISLHSGYHHLTNWGSCSFFVVLGERKKRPFFDEDGNCTMRDSVDIGLTVDERLADGYYYSRCVQLLREIFENPWCLDEPLSQELAASDKK